MNGTLEQLQIENNELRAMVNTNANTHILGNATTSSTVLPSICAIPAAKRGRTDLDISDMDITNFPYTIAQSEISGGGSYATAMFEFFKNEVP